MIEPRASGAAPGAPMPKTDLLAELTRVLTEQGITAALLDGALRGSREAIRAKWFLGGRKMTYTMSCRLHEAESAVHFREIEIERAWGIPPPTFTIEKSSLHGTAIGGTRKDISLGGGGGTLDYAAVREAVERATVAAGWRFVFEAGHVPEGVKPLRAAFGFGSGGE